MGGQSSDGNGDQAQTLKTNKGKNCDAEMARQPALVRAIKTGIANQEFRVRVELIEIREFLERYLGKILFFLPVGAGAPVWWSHSDGLRSMMHWLPSINCLQVFSILKLPIPSPMPPSLLHLWALRPNPRSNHLHAYRTLAVVALLSRSSSPYRMHGMI